MSVTSKELINELQKMISVTKGEMERLEAETKKSDLCLRQLISQVAEKRVKLAEAKNKIDALDAERGIIKQMEKLDTELVNRFIAMSKEVTSASDEVEKHLARLELEREAEKDFKSVLDLYGETVKKLTNLRYCTDEGIKEGQRLLENAKDEWRHLSMVIHTLENKERELNNELEKHYVEIPLEIKRQLNSDLKARRMDLTKKIMEARATRTRLELRLMVANI